MTRPASGTVGARLHPFWPELIIFLAWLIALVVLADMTLWHDIGWQLWIARQLNAGVPLYGWIMEVNPPLWYWMAQPVDLLAAATHWPAPRLLVIAVFLLIGISLTLAALLAASWPSVQRATLLAAMLAGSVIVILPDFAQREHLTFIAAIPYALLIACRIEGRPVPLSLAIAVALLAAPMFALKHYLALIPILLELWLIWRQRRAWRPVRPETAVLLAAALTYAAAIAILTPDYLSVMVPALSLAYGDLRVPLALLLLNQMNALLIVCLFYFWHFRHELSPATKAVLVVTAALTLSYYIQFKGWSYQITPVVACLLLAVALHLAQRPARPRLRWSEALTGGLVIVLSLIPGLVTGPYRNSFEPYADQLLARATPGMTAVMITSKAARMWSTIEKRGLQWPSRYYHFWMMQTVANDLARKGQLDAPLQDLVTRVRLETVEDLSCNPPDILIEDKASVDGVPFDMLGLFMQEPRFAALMQSYVVQSTLPPFTVYERIAPLPPPTGPCMTIAPVH